MLNTLNRFDYLDDKVKIGGCLAFVVLLIVIFFALNALAVWLWGILAVAIFGLPALTFWQMFGLRVLLWILIPTATVNRKGN